MINERRKLIKAAFSIWRAANPCNHVDRESEDFIEYMEGRGISTSKEEIFTESSCDNCRDYFPYCCDSCCDPERFPTEMSEMFKNLI